MPVNICMLSDRVHETQRVWRRKTSTLHYCQLPLPDHQHPSSTPDQGNRFYYNMGNTNTACQMSNYSKRNVRVFITEKAEEIDAFITSQTAAAADGGDDAAAATDGGGGDDDDADDKSSSPEDKKFIFRKDISCVHVLASQTQEVHWEPHRFLSVLVEDEEDENVFSKQIIHNMALSAPITVLLYDV